VAGKKFDQSCRKATRFAVAVNTGIDSEMKSIFVDLSAGHVVFTLVSQTFFHGGTHKIFYFIG